MEQQNRMIDSGAVLTNLIDIVVVVGVGAGGLSSIKMNSVQMDD